MAALQVIPAIDLLHGQAVRLVRGDFERVTVFEPDPVRLAHRFAESGAGWLHVVDLEGARAGHWCHLAVIERIGREVGVPVQAGGGARSLEQVRQAFEAGVARVLVGTAALESAGEMAAWVASCGERLAASLDGRGDRLVARGWTVASAEPLLPAARRLAADGVARFVYTDTRRDGTLQGVRLGVLRRLCAVGPPVLVAGGVSSYADLAALGKTGAEGAIVGRALLEGRIELRAALEVARQVG